MTNSETGATESREIDVMVAEDDAAEPNGRTVYALGARTALGDRAEGAKLLLFGSSFNEAVEAAHADRADLEIVTLERLYEGELISPPDPFGTSMERLASGYMDTPKPALGVSM